ncbi:putative monooxygenase [Streptomyces sp. NBRC 110611]|uniref:FAD-dependent monooxygenase n=1 Tax=Streptomyces sp. NBRC 110611 TaxID=1621259 RepID=UPI000834CB6F|nr:FAD-dependent monooxygenase [Streptomyces sp. NBRC 110611]GAU65841.1 putative monooxygenase [Streptomyces sp. NBRC 110611]
METEAEVLVVGAGPTGLLLAAELALAGVRTVVVERRTHPQRNSRALNLHPRSLELLDQRGLATRFLAAGRTVPGWQFAAPLRTPLDFSALDSSQPHALLLAQSRTEALLEGRARELGVRIHRGHEVTTLEENDDRVEVELRGPNGPVSVRAAYVAGCDGAHSIVRRAAGIAFPGSEESFTAMVGDFATADHTHLDRARQHGILAARNATRLAEHYRSGRLLLAGDAAHTHFPVGAQGLNLGLQDAMNLGWKLAAHIRGWAAPGLLDTYHTERHPVGRAVTEGTEAQTLLVELPLVKRYRRAATLLCELLDTVLGLPETNRYLAGHLSALTTAYPPPTPAAHPLTGRRIPDLRLTLPGGHRTRTYELLHDGHFVLLNLATPTPTPTSTPDLIAPGPIAPDPVTTVHARTTPAQDSGLTALTEVLIRPDGHIAWATETTDPRTLYIERTRTLNHWVR